VHLLHGTSDVLIPYRHSRQLAALKPQNIHLHPIKGAGHNNLPEFAEYHEVLYQLLE
jgi:pimeloyl-ACP methyl ester carboxylesterase